MPNAFFRITGTAKEGDSERWEPARHRAGPFAIDQIVVQTIRKLEDVKILKSYLWPEWWPLCSDGFSKICEDLSGIETSYRQNDPIQMLGYYLWQLDRDNGPFGQEMKG